MVARAVCPICAKDARSRAENPSFPFCSPPCKLVDLGRWLDGSYRIEGPPATSEDETPRPPPVEGDA